MIRPLDVEEDEKKELKKSTEEVEKKKDTPKSSSKILQLLGFILLLFVLGLIVPQLLSATLKKSSDSKSNKIAQAKSNTFPAVTSQEIVDKVIQTSSGIGGILLKAGQEAGSAVLGASVQFMERKAQESAPAVASAAASLVIKSTVPALVDQIEKLPKDQQTEVKKMICE